MQVHQKAELLFDEETVCVTRTTSTRDPTDSVHEEFTLGREIVVDDVIEERNVDTARRDISHHEHVRLLRSKSP